MSYSLPKYYFQDIHPDVMDEIMRGMQEALPEPSMEEIDNWLNTHNIAATIPGWYERADQFISDCRIASFLTPWHYSNRGTRGHARLSRGR